jgi:hypothetical protein
MNVKVISEEIDGAELRREQVRNPYHARCDGREDNEQIQDALDRSAKESFMAIRAEDYERIFGGKNGR